MKKLLIFIMTAALFLAGSALATTTNASNSISTGCSASTPAVDHRDLLELHRAAAFDPALLDLGNAAAANAALDLTFVVDVEPFAAEVADAADFCPAGMSAADCDEWLKVHHLEYNGGPGPGPRSNSTVSKPVDRSSRRDGARSGVENFIQNFVNRLGRAQKK